MLAHQQLPGDAFGGTPPAVRATRGLQEPIRAGCWELSSRLLEAGLLSSSRAGGEQQRCHGAVSETGLFPLSCRGAASMLQGHSVGPVARVAPTQQGHKLFVRHWCWVYDHLHQLWIHAGPDLFLTTLFIALFLRGVQGVISRR